MTLVSTIIPAFNAEAFIREAIDSALAQMHRDQEIIVVDDGSTDSTAKIVCEYGAAVTLIRQANRGVGAARNVGARVAGGEWFAFLDADDVWHPDKLLHQVERIANGVGLIYSDRENVGACQHVGCLQSDGVRLYQGDVFESLLLGNFITLSSVLMSQELFQELGGFNESPKLTAVEDWDLWLRASALAEVALVREPLTRYRWHALGISRDPDRMRQSLFHVLDRAFASPRGQKLSLAMKRRARAAAWSVVGWEAASKWPRAGTRYFLNSLACDPTRIPTWKQLAKSCLGRC